MVVNSVCFQRMMIACDGSVESYGAYTGALRVILILTLSFPLGTPSRSVTGRVVVAKIIDFVLSFASRFARDDLRVSLQWRHDETRRKHQKS